MKSWLLMTRSRALWCVVAWVASVVLHNFLTAAYQRVTGSRGEEPIFFLLAVVVIPLYVLISLAYTLYTRVAAPH
jgi:hypothetical protein